MSTVTGADRKRAYHRAYNHSEKGLARYARFNASERGHAADERYAASGREAAKDIHRKRLGISITVFEEMGWSPLAAECGPAFRPTREAHADR